MREIKASTSANVMVFMADSSDHITGKTGLTLSVEISKNGGAFTSISPTITERGYGWYSIALSTTDTDTLGDLVVRATAEGADPAERVLNVVERVESDTYNLVDAFDHLIDTTISSRASQASVDAIPINPLLNNDSRLNYLDTAISSRASQATADSIKEKTDKMIFTPSNEIYAATPINYGSKIITITAKDNKNNPIPDVLLEIRNANGSAIGLVTTNIDGLATINLEGSLNNPITYTIVPAKAFVTFQASYTIAVEGDMVVEITGIPTTISTIPNRQVIYGYIKDGGGNAIPNASIIFIPDEAQTENDAIIDTTPVTTISDANGYFELAVIKRISGTLKCRGFSKWITITDAATRNVDEY